VGRVKSKYFLGLALIFIDGPLPLLLFYPFFKGAFVANLRSFSPLLAAILIPPRIKPDGEIFHFPSLGLACGNIA